MPSTAKTQPCRAGASGGDATVGSCGEPKAPSPAAACSWQSVSPCTPHVRATPFTHALAGVQGRHTLSVAAAHSDTAYVPVEQGAAQGRQPVPAGE